MTEAYRIDEKWRLRPWKDGQNEIVVDKDGNLCMKRYKNGQVTLEGIVFSFSVYETKTSGYLLRGHMSMRSPRDSKVMQIEGPERKRIIAALEEAEKNVIDNEIAADDADDDLLRTDSLHTEKAETKSSPHLHCHGGKLIPPLFLTCCIVAEKERLVK